MTSKTERRRAWAIAEIGRPLVPDDDPEGDDGKDSNNDGDEEEDGDDDDDGNGNETAETAVETVEIAGGGGGKATAAAAALSVDEPAPCRSDAERGDESTVGGQASHSIATWKGTNAGYVLLR